MGVFVMEFRELCEKRYSVRSFLEKRVDREKLNLIVDNMRLTFSARNEQNWKFVVVDDKELLAKIASCMGQSFGKQAPAMILVLVPKSDELMVSGFNKATVNGSIATTILHYSAFDLGLGSVWIGRFDQELVSQVLGLNDDWQVMSINLIGYPAREQNVVAKKEMSKVVFYNGIE